MHPEALFFIGDKGVYLYGICIGVGILACMLVYFWLTKKMGMPEKVQDFSFIIIILAIALGFLSAKLYQACYDFIDEWMKYGFKNAEFDFYNAGLTAMGGFVGGAAMFILSYFVGGKLVFRGENEGLHVKEFNKIIIVAPLCILVAHAFGRLGCLSAGCCHGAYLGQDYVLGGIYMHTPDAGSGYFVPTQLYESLYLFALFGTLLVLFFQRCNCTMSIYLICYGLWRIFIEFFRADERGAIVLGLAPSQWQSILFIAGGMLLILIYSLKHIPFDFNYEFTKTKLTKNIKIIK